MRRGVFHGIGLALALLAASAGAAEGAAWRPAGALEGEVSGAVISGRGDVAALSNAPWPARKSTLYVRPAGGSFAAVPLPGAPSVSSMGLSDSSELVLTMTSGDHRDPDTSMFHLSSTGEQTVTPLPGFRSVEIAMREDGLAVLVARRGDDGQAVMAWKPPGAARFGEPAAITDVEPVRPSYFPHDGPPYELPHPPTLGFTEGLAVMLTLRGDTMEARAAPPHGGFGARVPLAPGRYFERAELAGRNGHMVAVWGGGFLGPLTKTFYAAIKRPGQGFGPPIRVADGIGLNHGRPNISASGHVVLPWSAGRPVPGPGKSIFAQHAVELRPGSTAFQPVVTPVELEGPGTEVEFDSAGATVMSGSPSALHPGFWTWSRAADGTLAGPDLVSATTMGGRFVLNGRGRGVAFGRESDTRTTVFDYDEAASRGRTRPVLSGLSISGAPGAASASARRTARSRFDLSLTKTARIRLHLTQLRRAGVVRVRCSGKARRRGRTCKRRRVLAGWQKAQVGQNTLVASRRIQRFLRRPGVYRVTARPRDSRGRYGRPRSIRLRVKR